MIIGASTGGPQAIEQLLNKIKPGFQFILIIANHFPYGRYTKILADSVSQKTNLQASVAHDKEVLKKGHTYICPGGRHIEITRDVVQQTFTAHILDHPAVNGCKPSIDNFFISTAFLKDVKVIGIILTGMGNDGLKGCKALQHRGHTVIAQDIKSCVAVHMPKHVINHQLADRIYNLNEISSFINNVELRMPALNHGKIKRQMASLPQSPSHQKKPLQRTTPHRKVAPISVKPSLLPERQRNNQFMSDEEFNMFKQLVLDYTGNITFKEKRELLNSKLQQIIKRYHFQSYSELYHQSINNKKILQLVLDHLTIHESYFFRDHYPFDFLKDVLFPELESKNKIFFRVWSSCCSDGQEPYSIAMTFHEYLKQHIHSPFTSESLEIIASDLSENCVKKTKDGIYNHFEISRGIDRYRESEYFDPLPNKQYRIKPKIRKHISAKNINICESHYDIPSIDIVFLSLCFDILRRTYSHESHRHHPKKITSWRVYHQ